MKNTMKNTRVERFGSFIKEHNEDSFEGHEDVFHISVNRQHLGSVTQKDGKYYTHGQLGEWNEYDTIKDLFLYLSGFDINLNDIYWN